MSIALDRNGGGAPHHTIQRSQFIHHGGMSCHRSLASGVVSADERMFPKEVEERGEDSDSCSSSSIGRNSDLSSEDSSEDGGGGGEDLGEGEVQSSFKGGPLDTMDALEEVLPIRRGISKHYNGKSKSFTSLSDAISSSSVKDLAKPVNLYNKKRKNELAYGKIWNKSHNLPPRSNSGGILKRLTNSSRSTLALGSSESSVESEAFSSISLSPPCFLPPLHPQSKRSQASGSSSPPPRPNNLPWRSFSLSDLRCIAPETPSTTGLVINN